MIKNGSKLFYPGRSCYVLIYRCIHRKSGFINSFFLNPYQWSMNQTYLDFIISSTGNEIGTIW